jgi:hypothetical protein
MLAPLLAAAALASSVGVAPAWVDVQVDPGVVHTQTITVQVDGEGSYRFTTTLWDWWDDGHGQSRFAAPGTLPRSAYAFASVYPSEIEVIPGQPAQVTLSVQPPLGATGTFTAVVFVEQSTSSDEDEIVQTASRVAIPVLIDAGGARIVQVVSGGVLADAQEGQRATLRVTNVGPSHVMPWFQGAVMGPDGVLGAVRATPRRYVLPGSTLDLEVPIDLGLEAGAYRLVGVVRHERDDIAPVDIPFVVQEPVGDGLTLAPGEPSRLGEDPS